MNDGLPYEVRFPDEADNLTLETEHFFVQLEGKEHKIRLHDYAAIYRHPGLYETVTIDMLQCRSPWVVTELLVAHIKKSGGNLKDVKAFDFGAGCGVAGEILRRQGVASIVGLDMVAEAAEAAMQDRPGVYDAYHVGDICSLDLDATADLQARSFNTLVCLSSIALGHIESAAFARAFNLITDNGWIAFNILKDAFDGRSHIALNEFYRKVLKGSCMDVRAELVYNHRLRMNGEPIENVAVVGKKIKNISG